MLISSATGSPNKATRSSIQPGPIRTADTLGLFTAPTEGSFELLSNQGSESSQLPAAPAESAQSPHNWPEREEVARGIGRFFVRSLEGGHCGSSGRDRISLPSRLYVIIRNRAGLVTTNPVRVVHRFSEVKVLCSQEGDFGDSIFCGFPSVREARCAVAAAGFAWPEEH